MKRRVFVAAALAFVLVVAFMTGLTVAQRNSETDAGGPRVRNNGVQAATVTLGTLKRSTSVNEPNALSTTSGTFVDIPGAVVVDTITGSARGGYNVTFSATCAINGAGAEEDVQIRVLVNNTEIGPGPATFCEDFETDNNAIPETAASAQYAVQGLVPGAYTIKVQFRTDAGATGIVRDFTLMVNRHKDV